MLADQREHACQTVDMSPSGIALIAPEKGGIGERVICYLDHFGRFEGLITRHIDGGFSFETNAPAAKREKLADRLTWFANRDVLGVPEGRDYERITPLRSRSFMLLPDGSKHPVALIDISLSGVAFASPVKAAIGTPVTIGLRPGRIARVNEKAIAVEFFRLIPREEFDERIEL